MDNNKKNKYEEYLPQNRYANEGGFSPGLSTVFVFLFVIFFGIMLFNIGRDNKGLKTEYRYYNLNLLENIRLDTINNDEGIEWESNSDCIVIEDGIVTAVSPGKAYIIGKKKVGSSVQQVTDLTINVLSSDKDMYLENHSIEMDVSEKQTLKVKQFDTSKNKNNTNNNSNKKDDASSVSNSDAKRIVRSSTDMQEDLGGDGNYNLEEEINDGGEEVNNSSSNVITTDDGGDDASSEDNPNFNNNLTYESSNPSVASVDNSGTIEPVSEGTTVITVTDNNGNEDHTYVTVRVDDVTIYSNEYNLKVGENKKIDYKINRDKFRDSDVKFTSDSNIITVDGSGNIKALKVGKCHVTIKVGDTTKVVDVVVSENIILPTDIKVSQSSVSLTAGDSMAIIAEVLPSNSTSKGLTWKSSNSNVVSVDQAGSLKAINAGNATISVTTSNGISKNINVSVKNKVIEVNDIYFNTNSVNLKVGESTKISYTIVPGGASDKTVKFTYDSNYVSLDEAGNLKALNAGNTEVKVTTSNGHSASLSVNITSPVNKVSEIKINEGNLKLVNGASKKLTVSVNPSNVNVSGLKWSSSNSNVVSVSNDGTIVAKGIGSANITASLDGKSSSITVEVSKKVIPVSEIVLNKKSITMYVGKTYSDLKVNVNPSDASNKSVVWSSSDKKVATVDKNGKITGVASGNVVITAKSSENGNIKAEVNVKVKYKVVLSLDCGSKTLFKGGNLSVKATVKPAEANQGIRWSSSNTNIATIDKNGKITGKAVGSTTITAKSVSDGSKTLSCNVTVKDIKYTVIINPSHQPTNTTVSNNSKYSTEMKSMYVLARIFESKLKNSGYNVVLTPDSGSIDAGDNCWQIDNWTKCGKKYVKWAVNKGKANSDAKNVYIALHSNAVGRNNSSITGPVVFHPYRYTSAKSKDLAKNLCSELVSTYNKYNMPVTWNATQCVESSKGVGEPSMYYDAGGKGAAVLIEVGFHDHVGNQQFIEKRGNELADAMVNAVNSYVANH